MTIPKFQLDKADQHISPAKLRTKCPLCNVDLLRKTLSRHTRSTHYIEDAPQACSQCDVTFNRKDSLERHRREQHGDAGKVVCDLCEHLVGRRWLKQHYDSQTCQKRRPAAVQFFAMETELVVSVTSIHSQPRVTAVMDPLMVVASFHQLAMLAYWAWEPLLQLGYSASRKNIIHGQLDNMKGEKCHGPVFSGHLLHMNSELPLISPELWKLRRLALTQTREALQTVWKHATSVPTPSHDDSIIQVSLLNAADCLLFGRGSDEHRKHAHGLASLLKSSRPTHEFISQLESLLLHTWSGISATFGQRHTDVEPNLRTIVNDISRRLLSRLIHKRSETTDPWDHFTPGVLGQCDSIAFESKCESSSL